VARLRFKSKNTWDTEFLGRLLQAKFKAINEAAKGKGATIPHVDKRQLESLLIPAYRLEEQKRIAAILDQADVLRRLRQRSIDRLNSLGQAIFYEMFGDPVSNSWRDETTLLTAVCEKITDGTHQAPEWSDNGIPFIFVSDIRNQRIDLETKKFVNQAVFEKLTKNTKIEAGDVLYTCVGSYGHTAVVDGHNKFVFQRHIAHLKPDKKIINPHFLAWCLESSSLKQQADRLATGIAQKTVTLSSLRMFKIPLPPLENQLLFATRVDKIQYQKMRMLDQLHQTDLLFQSLQHKAFNGEISE
jgi:type I restriction enzyme, S subunit